MPVFVPEGSKSKSKEKKPLPMSPTRAPTSRGHSPTREPTRMSAPIGGVYVPDDQKQKQLSPMRASTTSRGKSPTREPTRTSAPAVGGYKISSDGRISAAGGQSPIVQSPPRMGKKKAHFAPQIYVPGGGEGTSPGREGDRVLPPSGKSIKLSPEEAGQKYMRRPTTSLMMQPPIDPRLPSKDEADSDGVQGVSPKRDLRPSLRHSQGSPKLSPGSAGRPSVLSKFNKEVGESSWSDGLFIADGALGGDGNDRRSKFKSGGRSARSGLTRKNTTIIDKEVLETRWEWNKLLVSKAFKPYRVMMCEVDDDLPDPEDLEAIDDNDFDQHNEDLAKIRDEMLGDIDLQEREIAAFFEGYKMFQLKANSLKTQLEGMQAMQTQPTPLPTNGPELPALRSKGSLPMGYGAGNRIRSFVQPRPTLDSAEPRMLGRSLRAMSIKRVKEATAAEGNEEVQKLLRDLEEAESRQKKLERQLAQAGVVIAEDIPFDEAKRKVAEIARRMHEIGGSDVTDPDKEKEAQLRQEYFKLEQDMEKYTAALQLTDEWIEEQEELERKWEESVELGNIEALKQLRKHMPVDVRNMSENALTTTPSPNGKFLPKTMAKKFKRTNVLQLLRADPEDILRMHPSTLENMRVTGLTLTERRAMYAHLKDIGPRWKAMQAEKMTERKWTWYSMMKGNFKEQLASFERHCEQYGPPENHPYATRDNPDAGCPLIGNQCPVKANKLINYDGDYGFTEDAEYLTSEVKKSAVDDAEGRAKQEALEAIREKKAAARLGEIKKHYKGKLLQVSLAGGSCESMDEAMDKIESTQEKMIKHRLVQNKGSTEEIWKNELACFNEALNELKLSLLQFAERSGMQLTGKRDANADQPDIRSSIELGLCEEVIETVEDFFTGIGERMDELGTKDGRMNSTISQLRDLMEELHERNVRALEHLSCERPSRSRKLKTRDAITKEIKNSLAQDDSRETENATSRPSGPPGPPRGGLMAAIAGRGDGPGRGGLLSAIAGRGGGRGDAGGGGRGGLLSAIAARGGGADGGRGAGGRGGLLSAIAARGTG